MYSNTNIERLVYDKSIFSYATVPNNADLIRYLDSLSNIWERNVSRKFCLQCIISTCKKSHARAAFQRSVLDLIQRFIVCYLKRLKADVISVLNNEIGTDFLSQASSSTLSRKLSIPTSVW